MLSASNGQLPSVTQWVTSTAPMQIRTDQNGTATIFFNANKLNPAVLTVTDPANNLGSLTVNPGQSIQNYLAGTGILNYMSPAAQTFTGQVMLDAVNAAGTALFPNLGSDLSLANSVAGAISSLITSFQSPGVDTTGVDTEQGSRSGAGKSAGFILNFLVSGKPAYQEFAEIDDYYRELRRQTASVPMGTCTSFGDWVARDWSTATRDFQHAANAGLAFVKHVAVDLQNGNISSLTTDATTGVLRFGGIAIQSFSDALHAVTAILNCAGATLPQVLQWLRMPFPVFTDVVTMEGQITDYVTDFLSYVSANATTWSGEATAALKNLTTTLSTQFASAAQQWPSLASQYSPELQQIAQLQYYTGPGNPSDTNPVIPRAGGPSLGGGPVSLNDIAANPMIHWITNQIMPSLPGDSALGLTPQLSAADFAAWTTSCQSLLTSAQAFETKCASIASALNLSTTTSIGSLQITPIIEQMNTVLIPAVETFVATAGQDVTDLAGDILAVANAFLSQPVTDEVLTSLYSFVHGQQIQPTVLQIVSLLVAFPSTTAYQLVYGQTSAPPTFPDVTTPRPLVEQEQLLLVRAFVEYIRNGSVMFTDVLDFFGAAPPPVSSVLATVDFVGSVVSAMLDWPGGPFSALDWNPDQPATFLLTLLDAIGLGFSFFKLAVAVLTDSIAGATAQEVVTTVMAALETVVGSVSMCARTAALILGNVTDPPEFAAFDTVMCAADLPGDITSAFTFLDLVAKATAQVEVLAAKEGLDASAMVTALALGIAGAELAPS
jgi:hypothetical protein